MTSPTFIVVGAGIAGLNSALKLSNYGHVLVVTKNSLKMSNSYLAQGGFSALINQLDSAAQYEKDTLQAGAYHNKKSAVKFLVKHSKQALLDLIEYGVQFNYKNNALALTKEGGHSINRIAYAGDFTGREIMRALTMQARRNPNITIMERAFVCDLIVKKNKCAGITVIHENKLKTITAPYTIFASGGLGRLYKHTTNFLGATADGIAIALKNNIVCKDLEFLQFHPTALRIPGKRRAFLISEVLRGEGAQLINSNGKRFMKSIHTMAELAPRDLVAQQSFIELKKGPIYLQFKNKTKEALQERFPTIYNYLKKQGLALESDRIPVSPVMHYACGGIVTNLHAETSLKNFFAVGEVSYTGIHGANRLASNSLLEGIVFSNALADYLSEQKLAPPMIQSVPSQKIQVLKQEETKKITRIRKKLQLLMWHNVGIMRKQSGLKKSLEEIEELIEDLSKIKNQINQRTLETQNMLIAAHAITQAALKRTKSLGSHHMINES